MFERRGPTYTDYGSDAPRQWSRAKWWLVTGGAPRRLHPGLRAVPLLVRQHRPHETIFRAMRRYEPLVDQRECGIGKMAACGTFRPALNERDATDKTR